MKYSGKLKKAVLLAIVALTSFSCDSWLNVQPEDGVVRETYWKSKEAVRSAALGCYSQMLDAKMMTEYFIWGDMRAEMALPGSAGSTSDIIALNNGEITPSNTYVDWSGFYKTINQCNTVLKLAPAVLDLDQSFSEKQLKAYLAEVTCIRSLMYFI